MTYIEGRNLFRSQLKVFFEIKEIDFYYKMILKSFFKIEPTSLALEPKTLFLPAKVKIIKAVLQRLLNEEPLQYILGSTSFRSLELLVTPAVLIPRPETEELVEWVLEDYKSINFEHVVIDMGTGSGCIAISLTKEQPFFNVTALDISSKALEIAKSNAITLNKGCSFAREIAMQPLPVPISITTCL